MFDADLHVDSESRPGMLSLFQEDQENPMQTPGYVRSNSKMSWIVRETVAS